MHIGWGIRRPSPRASKGPFLPDSIEEPGPPQDWSWRPRLRAECLAGPVAFSESRAPSAMIQLPKCCPCIPLWLGCLINALVLFAVDLLENPLPYDVHCCDSLKAILFVLDRVCNIVHIMGCCSLFVASFVVSPSARSPQPAHPSPAGSVCPGEGLPRHEHRALRHASGPPRG